jgi:hypothetical protein
MSCVKLHAAEAGISGSFEQAMRFHLWAQEVGPAFSPALIRAHWNLSRATAYRWYNAYLAALGQPS